MLGNLRERHARVFGVGALLVLWTACPLIAGRFESQFATASAARWSIAIFLLAVAVALPFSAKLAEAKAADEDLMLRALVLLITLGPLILLTLSPVIDDINHVPARGPQTGIFRAMGSVALYGIPLLIAAAALGIHAVRERSAPFAFAAGLLVNFTVTTVLIVSVAAIGGAMNQVVLVDAIQLNAIAAACVGLAWIATRAWWMQPDFPLPVGERKGEDFGAWASDSNEDQSVPSSLNHDPVPKVTRDPLRVELILLTCQKYLAISFLALFIVPIVLRLIAFPNQAGAGTFAAGRFEGWLALLLVVALAIAFDKVFWRPLSARLLAATLMGAGSLLAFRVARFGVGQWAGLHVLLAAMILIPWLLLLARDLPRILRNDPPRLFARFWSRLGLDIAENWEPETVVLATLIGAGTVLVALRGPFSDPLGAWWSIGALLAKLRTGRGAQLDHSSTRLSLCSGNSA